MFKKIRRREISALQHALAVENARVIGEGGNGYGKLTNEECEKIIGLLQECIPVRKKYFLTDVDIKSIVERYQEGKCPVCDKRFNYDGGTSYCPECGKEWHERMILKHLLELLN